MLAVGPRRLLLSALLLVSSAAAATKPLQIFFVDVEGGQATLIVTPAGQSLLIDTGWPGFDGRDAARIAAAAASAGVKQLDYVLITHYHSDHVGGAPQLASKMKVVTFVDHGPNQEDTNAVRSIYSAYQELLNNAEHVVMAPGDRLPLRGVEVRAVSAAGRLLAQPLRGAGQSNPLCAGEPLAPADPSENARSLGTLLTFGKFRFIDLGDLTKQKEIELVCPNNLIGHADVYLSTHHGLDQSNARALVHALHPRVIIMNNGARKGGKPEAWETMHASPGLQDLWQLHTAIEAGADHNTAEQLIANPDEKCAGEYLKLTAWPDGRFTVFNSRNQLARTYKP